MPSKIKNITSGFNKMAMNEEDSISVEIEIKEIVDEMINKIENLHLHYCFGQILSNLEYLNCIYYILYFLNQNINDEFLIPLDQTEKYSDFHLITVFDMIKKILSQINTEDATIIYNFLLENDVLSFLLITLSKLTTYWTPFINIEVILIIFVNEDHFKFISKRYLQYCMCKMMMI